ncbi:MAG: hemerythrin domain-containing protein [bacterium]
MKIKENEEVTATEILKDEHRLIERMLVVLEDAALRIEWGEAIDAQRIRDILHFMRMFADSCHHRKEEMFLFPAMEEKGLSRESGPVGVMLEEHDLGRAEIGSMQDALQQYADGDREARKGITGHARKAVSILRDHIQKEDRVFFVMADQLFSEQEQTLLTESFRQAESSSVGCTMKGALVTLLDRLERGTSQQGTTIS